MTDPAATFANRLFEREAWARQRLTEHAGRTVVFTVGPLAHALAITDSGEFEPRPLAGLTPDLTLTLLPVGIPSFLADPTRWPEFVTETGDVALAATLRELAQTLPWFVERSFADVFGPVLGQSLADAGRHMLAFPEFATARVAESVARYARDEAELLAGSAELAELAADTAALGARIEAAAARIDALSARLNPVQSPECASCVSPRSVVSPSSTGSMIS